MPLFALLPARCVSRRLLPLCLALVLTACGGGGGATSSPAAAPTNGPSSTGTGSSSSGTGTGSGTTPAPAASVTTAAAATRFLNMATYGATEEEVQRLLAMGLDAWLDDQFSRSATHHEAPLAATFNGQPPREMRSAIWFSVSVNAGDQLRQRMALALSEIFAASDRTNIYDVQQPAVAHYYDLLLDDAFGNYRTLLQDVSLSPFMGHWLNMLGSNGGSSTVRADENFARELMQLFTVGLVKLNDDGSVQKDGSGNAIATYTQDQVTATARALTGWSWSGATSITQATGNLTAPMTAIQASHDRRSKTIIGGKLLPAGQTAEADLNAVLDTLFNDSSLPPFICRQLIQRLVTSNPSAAYVQRVVAVFRNDGNGVRGNLKAVVRAILTDREALGGAAENSDFGKLREPLIVLTHLWRAFHVKTPDGVYGMYTPNDTFGQMPLDAQTVFSFFRPDYAPYGDIRDAGLVAPEFQIANSAYLTLGSNYFFYQVYESFVGQPGTAGATQGQFIDVTPFASTAKDPAALVDRISAVLIGAPLPAEVRSLLIDDVSAVPYSTPPLTDGTQRALEAVFMILSSPNYMVFR